MSPLSSVGAERTWSERTTQNAVADLTAAIQLSPGCAETHFTRGTAYLRWGDNERAIADLTAAIQLKPDFGDAYFTRAAAYGKRYGLPANPGEWAKGAPGYDPAVADVTAADRLGPADPETREAVKWGMAAIRDAEQRRT